MSVLYVEPEWVCHVILFAQYMFLMIVICGFPIVMCLGNI